MLMSDFQSNSVPEFLYGIIDTQKRINSKGELQGSTHSFPYYLKDSQCPEQLFLLCENDDEKLGFDYYKFGMGHIVSEKFFGIIRNLNCSNYIAKKLTALVAKNDRIIRSDLHYIYFPHHESFIDEATSKLEEDKFGNLIPNTLILNANASLYDVFTINKTLLAGYIFLSEHSGNLISKAALNGIKIVELENAFKHHCKDYHYDVELSKKAVKKKLP